MFPQIPFRPIEGRQLKWQGNRVAQDNDKADDLIPGSLKRSKSYHQDYGQKTYKEIKDLAAANPPDKKARQMKKLLEQAQRLQQKNRGRRS
jgi:hypothetical protein